MKDTTCAWTDQEKKLEKDRISRASNYWCKRSSFVNKKITKIKQDGLDFHEAVLWFPLSAFPDWLILNQTMQCSKYSWRVSYLIRSGRSEISMSHWSHYGSRTCSQGDRLPLDPPHLWYLFLHPAVQYREATGSLSGRGFRWSVFRMSPLSHRVRARAQQPLQL